MTFRNTPRNVVSPFRRLPREFAVQHLLEAFGIRKLVEAAPIRRTGGIRERLADFRQLQRLSFGRLLRAFSFAIVAQNQFSVPGSQFLIYL